MAEDYAALLGARIRALREAHGFSIRELARRSNVKPESILRSEKGDTEITVSSIAKLCAVFNIELPAFFELRPGGSETNGAEAQAALSVLARLSLPQQRRVIKALQLLTENDRESSSEAGAPALALVGARTVSAGKRTRKVARKVGKPKRT